MVTVFKYDSTNMFGVYRHYKDAIVENAYIPEILDYRVVDYFYFQYDSFLSRNGGVSHYHIKLPLTQTVLEIKSIIMTFGSIGGTIVIVLTITRLFNQYFLDKKFKHALVNHILKTQAEYDESKEGISYKVEALFSYEALY